MSATCAIKGYNWSESYAYDAPKGTSYVDFSFYMDYAQTLDYYANPNGNADSNGRDGWYGFGDNPGDGYWGAYTGAPTWVIVTAVSRKGATLAEVSMACT